MILTKDSRTLSRLTGHRSAHTARRGSALVIALATLLSVAAIGAVFLQMTTSTTRRQTTEVENLRAFYLAEAGLAEAFQAVRIGRTGQVGSEAQPAVHGDGLLWVDATETADNQVRLVSTALVGRGRSTLAFVVQPIEIPLGFFSDEDLVIDNVLLVDGFNSEEATYEEEVGGLDELQAYASSLRQAAPVGSFVALLEAWTPLDSRLAGGAMDEFTAVYSMSQTVKETLKTRLPALQEAYYAGTLFPDGSPTASSDGSTSSSTSYFDQHTDSGGVLGSNGGIRFTVAGEPVEIFGDVVPGPDAAVEGLGSVWVSGDSEPRSALVELEPVDVPPVAMASPVRHDGLLPLIVSPGTSGHESIEVGMDAELILRGPATIVIGQLTLEPGALLTLDTRDGDVELYVTGGMDLQPGSVTMTTSDFPDELSIQVGAIAAGVDGPPVKLESTSQFHGTIYSPETDVRVGGAFEVYGGIVAKRLEIGAGAQLHFDNAKYEGSPIPRIISWKIVELPASVRGRRGDPYTTLGVERGTLEAMAEAHDLGAVQLTLEYLDHGGTTRAYSGTEDLFDWSLVASVLQLERDATRKEEGSTDEPLPGEEPPPEEPASTPEGIRGGFNDLITTPTSGKRSEANVIADSLLPLAPYSTEEWAMIYAMDPTPGGKHMDKLRDADVAAGGTGG